jgi:hypothetical protein
MRRLVSMLLATWLAGSGCSRAHECSSEVARVVSLDVHRWHNAVALADGRVFSWGDQTGVIVAPGARPISDLQGASSVVATYIGVCGIVSGDLTCVSSEPYQAGRHVSSLVGAIALQSTSLDAVYVATASDAYLRFSVGDCAPGSTPDRCDLRTRLPVAASDVVGAAASGILLREGIVLQDLGGRPSDAPRRRVHVPELATAVALTHSMDHGCAILGDRTARCWPGCVLSRYEDAIPGTACISGEPPDWHPADTAAAFHDPGLRDVVDVSHLNPLDGAGLDPDPVYCARLGDGSVWCWGSNGCGTTTLAEWRADPLPPSACVNSFSREPHRIALPGPATAIGTGVYHACALINDGSVYCWGSNYHGQLGDGSRVDSAVPVRVVIP